jgi:hypothetical protein
MRQMLSLGQNLLERLQQLRMLRAQQLPHV